MIRMCIQRRKLQGKLFVQFIRKRFARAGSNVEAHMATIRRRVVISGRVQGVNFRYYTRSMARQVGAVGWVRNLPDGNVEAVIEGAPEVVEEVISWCWNGPPSGRVDNVLVQEESPTGEFADFDIKYTGGYF